MIAPGAVGCNRLLASGHCRRPSVDSCCNRTRPPVAATTSRGSRRRRPTRPGGTMPAAQACPNAGSTSPTWLDAEPASQSDRCRRYFSTTPRRSARQRRCPTAESATADSDHHSAEHASEKVNGSIETLLLREANG
jgi:hypothetical protein